MSYFVPQLLNTLVGESEADVKGLFAAMQREDFDGAGFVAANAEARTALERKGFHRFALMFETLHRQIRQRAANVHPVAQRAAGVCAVCCTASRWSCITTRRRASATSRIWVSTPSASSSRGTSHPRPWCSDRNPAQSESLVGIFPGASEAAPTTFALDLDDTWETSVGSLIEAASFIVGRNHVVRDGLRTELRLLQERGRLGDAFFTDAHEAQALLPGKTIRRLDDGALALMKHATRPRDPAGTADIAPTCWWVQGDLALADWRKRARYLRSPQPLVRVRPAHASRHPSSLPRLRGRRQRAPGACRSDRHVRGVGTRNAWAATTAHGFLRLLKSRIGI